MPKVIHNWKQQTKVPRNTFGEDSEINMGEMTETVPTDSPVIARPMQIWYQWVCDEI